MTITNDFHPEFLRPVKYVCNPDPRNTAFVKLDRARGDFVPLNIQDQYDEISEYVLHATVPEDIRIQFETVKNLYLYAWFVYRFYPVAEHQALACLEMALRKRYEGEAPNEYRGRDGKLYLNGLLKYGIDRGHIKPEGFRRWQEDAQRRATVRYETEKTNELLAKGLKQIDLDYSKIMVMDADRNWDYLGFLAKFLPDIRSHYAHGSSMLHNQVLTTIEIVLEIINQIFPGEQGITQN